MSVLPGKDERTNTELSNKAVAQALGGLPATKMHCSKLAADAIHKAIEDYRSKKGAAQGAPAQ